jgi:hypothetical protein
MFRNVPEEYVAHRLLRYENIPLDKDVATV